MLDYTRAQMLYQGRVDNILGRKVATNAYMIRDEANDAFIVRSLKSRYIIDSVTDKWRRRKKKEYEFTHLATVSRSGVTFTDFGYGSTVMYRLWGLKRLTPTKISLSGFEWHKDRKSVMAEKVALDAAGNIVVTQPSRQRVLDRDKMKPFNDKVKQIRNMLRVRNNLGVLEQLDIGTYDKPPAGPLTAQDGWSLFADPEKFEELLETVDPHNLDTFPPLMWAVRRHGLGWYGWRQNNPNNWPKLFDNAVNCMREKIRRKYNAVEYV